MILNMLKQDLLLIGLYCITDFQFKNNKRAYGSIIV